MARQPRFLPPDHYFHVMNRGNNGQLIFTCDEDYIFYLEKLYELKAEHPFELIHYSLMGTHTHMLVKILKDTDFSVFSKRLNLSYAIYFKKKYGLIGHFWQGRFKSQLVYNDAYFMQCGKYIELNSVRAGLVERPEDYKWSSYRHYALSESSPFLTDDLFYIELGKTNEEREKKYRDMIVSDVVTESMHGKQLAIGDSKFVYNVNRKNKYHTGHKGSAYR